MAIFKYDQQAVSKLQQKLKALEELQAKYKATNKAVRKKDNEALRKLGLSDDTIAKLYEPDFCRRIGIPNYRITNNGAEIRRYKKRILEVSEEQARAQVEDHTINGAVVSDNVERGSTEIYFGQKPAQCVLDRLHNYGWRYAPSTKTWYKCRRDDYILEEARMLIETEKEAVS
jgi:hypothetical protein